MLDPIKIGLIMLVAALVLGPEKLPEFAKKVGVSCARLET